MYSLEWHTLGMLHKNMHYEIVNCTLKGETRARCAGIDETPVEEVLGEERGRACTA